MDHRHLLDSPFAIDHGVALGNMDMAMDVHRQMFAVTFDGVAVAVIGRRRVGGTFKKHLILPRLEPVVGAS